MSKYASIHYELGKSAFQADLETGWINPAEFTEESLRHHLPVVLGCSKEFIDGYVSEFKKIKGFGHVFSLCEGEWQVRIGNEVLPTTWNSRGAALSGLDVEMKRRGV